ncbi:hypothetical protein MPUL_45800 [Mycolicibacterium pulveris]|uniref:Mce/MlaD domain-containing protein n=1 Tax=Mycolicibacterium pulveris TaxID=36813 RepID=A0A7I7UPN7_MYCPV|nr:MlaD family protein [Mycolicibacterium pulveris]BBY83422.1 hypothetical protein MPUL_45800 [Mycolicibacterium pulveris]
MPDSVGLYVGNPVTHMGYPIGEVTAINPSTSSVQVEFTVGAQHAVPVDVKAVTRSTSILADRALELVGEFGAGPSLQPSECIPLARSSTPKSLSEVVGSAATFLNAVNPQDSTNLGGVVTGIDQALQNNGAKINQLLRTSSAVLDSPDQAIGDIGSIIANLAELTSTLDELREPLKEALLDAHVTTPDLATTVTGSNQIFVGIVPLISLIGDLEAELGEETQRTLDDMEVFIRKAAAHSTFFASLLKPGARIVDWLARHANDHEFNTIRYRPPLYRIPTKIDGLVVCGVMNASMPGSCADVAGTPYAVDVALLQYVLSEAARR